ncbi:MAG: AAA family ATPase, partial [Solirubrobacterales bacterium]|nr:AAA family ATPase [Solirubrobacterales bacterium]
MTDDSGPARASFITGPLLGRARELADLHAGFDDAARGRARMHLIVGEPGVGKTRLAEELVAYAAAQGAVVAWSSGWGPAAPAYWPWTQVVRALVRDDPAARGEDIRAAGPKLLRLVPALGELVPDLSPPAEDDDDEHARFGLFDSLAGFLRARSRSAPLVLVFDDLQAVDEGTLLALDFVSRDLQDAAVLIVCALHERTPDLTPEAQARLSHLARAGQRILLRGLDAGDLTSLVENAGGGSAAPALARALHAATEGNPFFAHEIVRLLVAEGRLADAPDDLPLPDSVRGTIRLRLASLSATALRTLEFAAILGHSFRHAVIVRAAGLDAGEVLASLDEATALGVITEDASPRGQHRFVHGLIRDALIADLPAGRRIASHHAVAVALEDAYGPAIESHLAEVAHHYVAAAPGGDPHKALEYSARAAERTLASLAYEQAAELFEQALEVLELTRTDLRRRATLRLGLGEAQARAGRPQARETFLEAAAAARAADAPDLLGAAAIGMGPFGLAAGFVDDAHVALLEEALDRLGTGDDPLRVRLLGSLAAALYWSTARSRREE